MRKLFLAAAFILFFFHNARAVSSLPFYEPFPSSYSGVIGTGASASIWSIGNTGSTGGAVVFNFGDGELTYPNLFNPYSDSQSLYIYDTPPSNRNKGAPFTPQVLSSSNRTVYASFLMEIFSPPTSSRLFVALSSTGSGTTPSVSAGVWLDPANHILISKNSNATPTATNYVDVSFGTHLVVLRYKWNPSLNDDEVALWVDPPALGIDEGSVPVPPATTTTGVDVSTIQSIWIVHTTAANLAADLIVDEFRVATNWAGVTPTTNNIPSPFSQPSITQAFTTPDSFVLQGVNGPINGAYQVLTATNLAALPYQWNIVATGLFAPDGSFDFTNPITAGEPKRFYRLLIGGAVPPVPIAPSIVTQPTNQIVIEGQPAIFSVVASGDPVLAYQWYFNTNTLIPNATNASMILTSAQLTNSGSYSVIVTNNSGSVTSVVATLTVNPIISGPSISSGPFSLVVTQGQNAFFSVTAGGTPPLDYQWYFNTNTLLQDATNSSLTLLNVQPSDAGAYSVTVANTNGSVSSTNAILTVLSPPAILIQPSDQFIITGQVASFTVTATGTAPLLYQWFFNTNTLVPDATNSFLSTSNAGVYSVVVSNSVSSITSVFANLNIYPLPTNTSPVGFATVNGNTTGGAGGPVVTVSNAMDFATQIATPGPLIIQVQGTIELITSISGAFNKTILGLGTNATLIGDLALDNATNIIIQNVFFSNPSGFGGGDGITLQQDCDHIWVDHCTFYDCSDGELDIVRGCDFITVSWCKFFYTSNTGHNFVNLVGNDQNLGAIDSGRLHVTFEHNWWSTLCVERMPRVRFGQVHVFNNYHDCTGNNYCVRAGYLSEILVENNYYDHINTPYEYFLETTIDGDTAAGLINATGNATPGCTNVGTFSDTVFTPPYAYTLEDPAVAKAYVLFGAGAGTSLFP
jgi:pectate lyase